MKRFTLSFVILFAALPVFMSCNFSSPIHGNHQLLNRQLDVTDYDELELNIPAEVYYQQFSDSPPYLQIHTDENIFDALDVQVKGHKLIISVKKDSIIIPSQLTVYTSSHQLGKASITGSGNLYLKGEVNAKNFDMSITGSGGLITDSLLCETIKVRISGSGNAQLKGAGKESSFTITGSGNINAYDYYIGKAKCRVTGSGDIKANIIEELDASITGSGNVFYCGYPKKVESKVTGSGRVKQTDSE
jgi:hypothetical protein